MNRRTIAAAAVLAALLALAGTACGDDEETAPPTTAPPPAETTPPPPPPPPPPATTAPAQPQVRTIRIFVEQGRPKGGIRRPVLEQGERVRIVVRTDAGVEVHLHGYDITRPVRPGQPTQLAFRATIPGRFELELHHPDAVLAELEVRP
jgi:hypothetical protein